MNLNINYLAYLYLLIPIFLITGPAVPDISLTLISLFGFVIFYKNFSNLIEIKTFKIFTLLFAVFYVVLIIGSFYSIEFQYSFLSALPYIRFYFFTVAIFFLLQKNFKFYMNLLYYILTAILLILSIDGIYEYLFDVNIFNTTHDSADFENRLSGLFGKEWIIGFYIVRFIPVYIFLFLLNLNNKSIYLFLFTLSLSLLTIFLSGERSALFLSFIVLFFLLLNFNKYKKLMIFFILLILLIFLISNIYNDSSFNRILLLKIISEKYFLMFKTSILMFIDSPVFGNGIQSYRFLCSEAPYSIDNGVNCSTHPHSNYLQILAENGIINFLIIVFIFFFFLFHILFLLFNQYNSHRLFLYLTIIINLFPLLPSLNFFYNWHGVIIFFSVPMLLIELSRKNLVASGGLEPPRE